MGMGWYGPLVDLSAATFHVGDFVQLLVFVHRSTPLQYKLSKGGEVMRTDIDVGDETRPFFSISLWNNHLASCVSAGDILFFRNVKVIKFRSMVEAKTVHYSSIQRLIHPYSSLLSTGLDDLMNSCPVVGTAKEKLRRVIHWVQQTKFTLCNQLDFRQTPASRYSRNWKVLEEEKPPECLLLSEVIHLSDPCNAIFLASIGEVFLHSLWPDATKERLFISRRLTSKTDIIVEDMICTGCQLCGCPFSLDSPGLSKDGSVYCDKNSNRLHVAGVIYRPFMLYVWDSLEYIPLLVKNKAAELLFGNISAEKLYQSYKGQKDDDQNPMNPLNAQVGNRSLKFEVFVNPSLAIEDGRFEMLCMSMSYFDSLKT
ncbi:unnamed protein product [Amaranthus hypochondriacus]